MSPTFNINGSPSLETSFFHGDSSSVYDENDAAGALLSFTTPPSSHDSPARDSWEISLDTAPTTGGFFPAQSVLWDGCSVRNTTGPEVQAPTSSIVPPTASPHSMIPNCLDHGITVNEILDKIVMAQKLALVRASKALDESPEMKEAAGLLAILQTTPAPWSKSFNERVAQHQNSGQEALSGMDNFDPDATEDEEPPEEKPQEQPAVSNQQGSERHTNGASSISEKAAGKRKEKYGSPILMKSAHSVTLLAAIIGSSASRVPTRPRPADKGSASTQKTAKTYEFVNQINSNIAGHKRKRAPPTPRHSAGSGKSPVENEAPEIPFAKPAESLPTPPLRTVSAATLETPQLECIAVMSKLSRTPDGVDDEEEDGKEKQERTSKSGRTIKNTEKWTTSESHRR
ncbi:hypothetical protein MMC26_003505 [Xylographa opegraphella]|nr:hypothetical protein [Xylographa opegraphella]